ncbi:MAG: ATP-binding protein [Ferruginibacter sp.]
MTDHVNIYDEVKAHLPDDLQTHPSIPAFLDKLSETIYTLKENETDSSNSSQWNQNLAEEILHHLPAEIAIFDVHHRYIFVNKAAVKNDEVRSWLIGKDDFDYCTFKHINNEQAFKRRGMFNETIEKKTISTWIDQYQQPNGDTQFILRHFYPHFKNGALNFVIGYGVDITEQKRMEIDLANAFKNLKAVNQELEQFAYIASHDMNEPLRMVTGFLSLLENKYKSSLDEQAQQYVGYALNGAQRLRQMLIDLLDYSRANRITLTLENVDVHQLLKEISISLQPQITEKQVSLQVQTLPSITTDKNALKKIFQHLLSNAIKFVDKNKLPIVTISCIETSNQWQFTIEDNGIGIPEKDLEKIFLPFHRLHSGSEYPGSGMGLSTTKKIITHLQGSIVAFSEITPNSGSRFVFTLPKI